MCSFILMYMLHCSSLLQMNKENFRFYIKVRTALDIQPSIIHKQEKNVSAAADNDSFNALDLQKLRTINSNTEAHPESQAARDLFNQHMQTSLYGISYVIQKIHYYVLIVYWFGNRTFDPGGVTMFNIVWLYSPNFLMEGGVRIAIYLSII